MKRLLDKTWAKLAAFFLTLLFIALTALGGIGIGILASYNVFLDGGAYLRQTMYESQCNSAIHNAYYYLYGTMANAGLLADDTPDTDASDTSTADITEEEQQQALEDMPRAFAERFSREDTDCHLAIVDKNTGEITFENFALTDSDKPLYSIQETFTLTYADGSEEELTIAADLLPADEFPDYSYLVMTWLLNHIGLTVFLTVLFLLLTLLCFGFSMASAGHWAGHEGIHLTWLDKIPADVWLLALLCAFFIGWDTFYYGLGRLWVFAALLPFLLLFLCVFAAQCKAGTVLRCSLTARILRLLWRILRAVGRGLRRTAVALPLIWKTALVTAALFFLEMLLVLVGYGSVDGIFVAMKLVEFLAILYIALNLRILQKGGEKLAAGDLSQSIDIKPLIGDFKRYGQRMNDLRTGMERAVQEQTKAERMKTELITNVSHDIKTPDLHRQLCGPAAEGGCPAGDGTGVHRRAGSPEPPSEKADGGSGGGIQSVLRRAAGGASAHGCSGAVRSDRGRVSGAAGRLPSDTGGPTAGEACLRPGRRQAPQPRYGQSGQQYLQIRAGGHPRLRRGIQRRGDGHHQLQECLPGRAEHLPR